MNEIEKTSLWVAGIRAIETERENPLFQDLFARQLVGEDYLSDLRRNIANEPHMPPAIEVRTRWIDDEIILAAQHGVHQVIILAAGMDARAYRLPWPENTKLYEIDHPDVLENKQAKLTNLSPRCTRYPLSIDLREDWPTVLQENDFLIDKPSVWLVEGLLCYLEPQHVTNLFSQIDKLSTRGSVALYDVVGRSMLQSHNAKMLHALARQFGTDEPETLLTPHGWHVKAHTIAEMGHKFKRWPFPLHPRGTPGIPQSFVARAVKQ
jgi:methyltransferase (TIGR00027 family)